MASWWAISGPLGEFGRPGQGRVQHVIGRHHPVHQSDGQRFLGPDLAAGEDEFLGPGRTDQAGQPLGAAAAGDHAEQHFGQADLGVLGADAEVTGQGQFQTAAQGVAIDGGDGGPRDRRQCTERAGEVGPDGAGTSLELHDLGAGGENATATPQHHRTGRVVAEPFGHLVHLRQHGTREGIGLRAVEPDQRHPIGSAVDGDEFLRH